AEAKRAGTGRVVSMGTATQPTAIQAQRVRALIVPREHGAWGILLVPLATGAIVGLLSNGRVFPLVLLTLLALALFWLRTPVEGLLGTSPMRVQTEAERRIVLQIGRASCRARGEG